VSSETTEMRRSTPPPGEVLVETRSDQDRTPEHGPSPALRPYRRRGSGVSSPVPSAAGESADVSLAGADQHTPSRSAFVIRVSASSVPRRSAPLRSALRSITSDSPRTRSTKRSATPSPQRRHPCVCPRGMARRESSARTSQKTVADSSTTVEGSTCHSPRSRLSVLTALARSEPSVILTVSIRVITVVELRCEPE
jgi:hypothetical protein